MLPRFTKTLSSLTVIALSITAMPSSASSPVLDHYRKVQRRAFTMRTVVTCSVALSIGGLIFLQRNSWKESLATGLGTGFATWVLLQNNSAAEARQFLKMVQGRDLRREGRYGNLPQDVADRVEAYGISTPAPPEAWLDGVLSSLLLHMNVLERNGEPLPEFPVTEFRDWAIRRIQTQPLDPNATQ